MNIGAAMVRVVAFLAVVGLVLGPLARPAAAATMMQAQSSDMSPDMPCCPDEASTKDCAVKPCPFMGVCTGIALQAVLPGAIAALAKVSAADMDATSDAGVMGLASGPPARPPKA